MLIEAKVKVTKLTDGKYKKFIRTYLMDREFFSQVEYTVTDMLDREGVYDFEIYNLKWSTIKEVCDETYDARKASYVATLKATYIMDDGTEKATRYKTLLWAENLADANVVAQQLFRQGYDMVIEGIKQSDYIYVTESETEEEEENQ